MGIKYVVEFLFIVHTFGCKISCTCGNILKDDAYGNVVFFKIY